MFKPQTKDKQKIDELTKENLELKAEIVELKGLVKRLMGNTDMAFVD